MFGSMYLFLVQAFAVPTQFTQQGRVIDSNGTPMEGSHFVRFALYESDQGGTALWEDSLYIGMENGFFSTEVGANPLNPLDSELLTVGGLFLEMSVNNTVLEPRQSLGSVPYARVAQTSESIDGGTVNASQISVNGNVVIDGNGSWMGNSISLQWSDIQNIPNDFVDGVDNDSQLSQSDVITYVVQGGIDLHADTTIGGISIQTGDDLDSLADISCVDDGMILTYNGGFWDCGYDLVLDSADVVAMIESETDLTLSLGSGSTVNGERIQTGIEQDSLAEKVCSGGEILVYNMNLGSWDCGVDSDTTLTSSEVKAMVEAMSGLALQSGATVNGSPIVTENSLEWSKIQNRPTGLDDGDNDTQLTSADVVSAVENSSITLAEGSTIAGSIIIVDPGCTDQQVLQYHADSGNWVCVDFSSALDKDQDGVLAWEDCDDNDPTTVNDMDCDGIATADDCDDTNASSTVVAEDADCDGIATADDCNDSNASITTSGTGGSEDCAAASCKEILDNDSSIGNGIYWLKSNGSSVFEGYCDMTVDGGGWTLIFNLDTNDSNTRQFSDTSFWTSTSAVGSISSAFTSDFKSLGFEVISGSSILFQAHMEGGVCTDCSSSSTKPHAIYNLQSQYTGSSLHDLLNSSANTLVSSSCTSSGRVVPDNTYTRVAGDIFIDRCEDFGCLTMNSTWHLNTDADNQVRFGTSCSTDDNLSFCSSCYGNGHNVQGGIGGYHDRNGNYPLSYEYQPQIGYHPGPYGIGDNFINNNGCGQSVWNNTCGPTTKRAQIDLAIYIR